MVQNIGLIFCLLECTVCVHVFDSLVWRLGKFIHGPLNLFLRMIKPVSMLPFCMYAANYSNLTSSLVLSVSAVSSIMWQECGLPCARLRGTDGEWQGRELPSKINRSTVLQLAFQRGWLYALKSLSCLTETRCSIGSDKIRNFIYQATKMVVLSWKKRKKKDRDKRR